MHLSDIKNTDIKRYEDLVIEAHSKLVDAKLMLTSNAVNSETLRRFRVSLDEMTELILDAHRLTHPM